MSWHKCPGTGCGTRKRPSLATCICPKMAVSSPEKKAGGQRGPYRHSQELEGMAGTHGQQVTCGQCPFSLSLKAVRQLCSRPLVSMPSPHPVSAAFPRWRSPSLCSVRGCWGCAGPLGSQSPSAAKCHSLWIVPKYGQLWCGCCSSEMVSWSQHTQLGLLAHGQVWDDVECVIPCLTSRECGGRKLALHPLPLSWFPSSDAW